jgi:hypothetical protein
MNWKGCGRKRSWPNFKVLSRHLSGRTEEDNYKYVRIAGLQAEINNCYCQTGVTFL